MEFRILGPLEVWIDGNPVVLGGRRQRAVLAILLLYANEVVSRDVLIDEVWAGRPPTSAGHTLEAYVHRLRRLLRTQAAGESVLLTRPPGYVLRVAPGQLDLERFERLAEEGRSALSAGVPERAAERLRAALGLWRGRPLSDLEEHTLARVEVERLAELRLSALEDRFDADLARGEHRALVPELEALIAEHPLRERVRGQLMLALYRSGRQADALAAYRDARRFLHDELGLEPSPELRALQAAILAQDPALSAVDARLNGIAVARSIRRRRAPSLLLAVLLVTLVVTAGAATAVIRAHDRHPTLVAGNALVAFDGASGRPEAHLSLGAAPSAVAFGFGSLWVTQAGRNSIVRVDPSRGVVQTIAVGSGPSAVATGGGAVWVANTLDGTVTRVEPDSERVVQRIRLTGTPVAVVVAYGAVWVAGAGGAGLVKIDPRSGRTLREIALDGQPSALTAGGGSIWVGTARGVSRIDPRRGAVRATIRFAEPPSALAAGLGSLWVSEAERRTVSRIDPERNSVTAVIRVHERPAALAVAGDRLWVASDRGATLEQISSRGARRTHSFHVDGPAAALTVAGGRVWAGVGDQRPGHRGGTLVLLYPAPRFDSIDPAVQGTILPPQLLGMTNDGLVTFAHVGGREGSRIVPDLANSVPRPTDHGRSYGFQLRPGIRYSNGAPVRASDIRRGIERALRLTSAGTVWFSGILGWQACRESPAHCDLSAGIVTDDRRGTVVFHLAAPDPDFPSKLALPQAYAIPPGAPNHDVGRRPIPATGPYRIATYRPGHELRLLRNPNFRQWSADAQPDGYPDEIVWKLGVDPYRGITAVEQGRADWMLSLGQSLPREIARDLERRIPARLHINPLMQTDYLIFNVNVPPFDDVRVRRAVNYALDRAAIARLFGPSGAQPTCQVLPPQMPGYRRYCPYTSRPDRSGAWKAPDLVKARRLVEASRTRGMRVAVWDTPEPGTFLEEGRAAVAVLKRLGYHASLKLVADARYARVSGNSRYRIQMSSGGWSADYPAPSAFINLKLSCRAFKPNTDYVHNAGGFCDPALDRRAARAQRLQGANPAEAAKAWAAIDRELVNRAVWLPMVTPETMDLISPRAGNYQFHPLWGLLVDQLWVH